MQITATPIGDGRIPAHVQVSVDSPPPGTDSVTVTRTAERRTFLTRGFVGLTVFGDLFVRDFEAPFDVAAVYTATAVDAAGATVGTATSPAVVLQSTRSRTIVVHDPVRPKKTMTLLLEEKALTAGSRRVDVENVDLHARSVPLAAGTLRRAWTGLPLDVVTFSEQQMADLDALLGGYDEDAGSGVLCIRPSGDVPIIPRVLFASIPDPKTELLHPGRGPVEAIWRLTANEVAPPAPALVEPVVTHSDWTAWLRFNYGWTGFNRTFASWSVANRSLIPLGWADRAEPRRPSFADLEKWLRDNGGWPAFNARFATWVAAMQDEELIGWASR